MKKKRIPAAVGIVLAAIVLAAIGWACLPDTLVTQIGLKGQVASTMPKALGLSLPLGLTAVFSTLYCVQEEGKKNLVVALAGVGILAITLMVNL